MRNLILKATWQCWYQMNQRCNESSCKAFADYGGRGITVHSSWSDFAAFQRDMGDKPEGLTLDRIDNNKDYGPDNCRWATSLEQGANKRNNIRLTFMGQTLTLSEWARALKKSRSTLFSRHYRGWPPERVLGC